MILRGFQSYTMAKIRYKERKLMPVDNYLIHVGRLIDGTGMAPVKDAAILVRNGLIEYAGPRENVPSAENTTEILGENLTAMPGLIDGHNGLVGYRGMLGSVEVLRHYLQFGITTAVSFHGNPEYNKQWGVPLRDAINAGQLRGCARLVVGHVVNCTNAHNQGRTADGPWEVRKAVREMAQAGADFIKTAASGGFWGENEGLHSPNYTQEELDALVDEAHSWQMLVGVHCHSQPGMQRAVTAGADIIYHGCLMDEKALREMAKRGTWFLPTLRITCERNLDAWPDSPWQRIRMGPAAKPHREGFQMALEFGVPIAMGSDGPGSSHVWRYGESSTFEVAEMARCGMTNLQAISAATQGTAKAYRIDDRVGTLQKGKEADIVLRTVDPLENINSLQDPKNTALVLQKGKIEFAASDWQKYFCPLDKWREHHS